MNSEVKSPTKHKKVKYQVKIFIKIKYYVIFKIDRHKKILIKFEIRKITHKRSFYFYKVLDTPRVFKLKGNAQLIQFTCENAYNLKQTCMQKGKRLKIRVLRKTNYYMEVISS